VFVSRRAVSAACAVDHLVPDANTHPYQTYFVDDIMRNSQQQDTMAAMSLIEAAVMRVRTMFPSCVEFLKGLGLQCSRIDDTEGVVKEVSRQQVEHVAYGSRRVFVAVSEQSILPDRQLSLLFLDVSRILYGLRHKAPTRMDYGPGHLGGRPGCLVGGVGVPSNPMLVLGIADFESLLGGAKTRFL
jgi:hypothetical protein